ncbi:MAG: hypothetical protein HOP23_03450 [Methylococcaceae bacterium]|nr:hypothetical protein [Methylococcaceae bacterium]
MLYLAKFAGIAVLVWFYLTAKDKGESGVQWAIIGLIGYWVTWWLVKLTVLSALVGMVSKTVTMVFLVTQIPAFCAIAAAVVIRKKLLTDAAGKKLTSEQ